LLDSWIALILVRCSLLDIVVPLIQHCYSFCLTLLLLAQHRCCSLFNIAIAPCSTLPLFLLNITIVPCPCCYCSLLNTATILAQRYCPCLTLLVLLLDIVVVPSSTLLMLLLNITSPLAQRCYSFTRSSSCNLLRYLFVMFVMLLFLAPCLTMLLLFFLFHISNPPLSFLQV
jgi:hypothetical protein